MSSISEAIKLNPGLRNAFERLSFGETISGYLKRVKRASRSQLGDNTRQLQPATKELAIPQFVAAEPLRPAEQKPEPTPHADAEEKRRGRTESPVKELRWKAIREVFKANPKLEGEKFWKLVHDKGGRPELTWRSRGCPRTLHEAFAGGSWTETLNQDKSRATQHQRKQTSHCEQ
jgi:hypothetical protein